MIYSLWMTQYMLTDLRRLCTTHMLIRLQYSNYVYSYIPQLYSVYSKDQRLYNCIYQLYNNLCRNFFVYVLTKLMKPNFSKLKPKNGRVSFRKRPLYGLKLASCSDNNCETPNGRITCTHIAFRFKKFKIQSPIKMFKKSIKKKGLIITYRIQISELYS